MMSAVNGSSSYDYGYMQQQRPQGPKLDTNNDNGIDLQELDAFSAIQSEKTGTTFDAQEVMSQYDLNQDGLIDETEGASLREDNGLNLPSPEELQAQMMAGGGNRPQGPPPGGMRGGVMKSGGMDAASSMSDSSSYSIDALLEALETDDDDTSVSDDTTIELLESMTSSTSTYSAAEIAAYDTNGDGIIDATEEAAMNQTEKEDLTVDNTTTTNEQFARIMRQAISAYSQSMTDSSDSLFDEIVA